MIVLKFFWIIRQNQLDKQTKNSLFEKKINQKNILTRVY